MNIVNEIQLSYTSKGNSETQIRSSDDAYKIFMDYVDKSTIEYNESFYVLCLTNQGKALGIKKLHEGGITQCTVDIKMIMQTALLTNAVSIIIAHNHPGGNAQPSSADIDITNKIKEACKIMEISLLDHVILTLNSYYSFADEGML